MTAFAKDDVTEITTLYELKLNDSKANGYNGMEKMRFFLMNDGVL